ncbi:ABC transporter permease [Gynuella sp.]|uniref:ABC transporter permease n=1 Tax=Gynuella sp. TaxID=2969146 RepID=UPI003D0E7E92
MLARFLAIFNARNRETIRDRRNFGWNLFLPFLLVFGFAYIFSNPRPDYRIGVIGEEDAYLSRPQLLAMSHLQIIPYQDLQEAKKKLRLHQIDLVLQLDDRLYWVNKQSSKGYFLEKMLHSSDPDFRKREVEGDAIRYIDWVIPGVIGMNILYSCLFGVGYAIVRYRRIGVLKRFKATPLTAFEFLAAQVASRWILVMFFCSVIFFGCHWTFSTVMLGSYLDFFVILALGIMAMIGLALVIASRTRSEELTSGLLNMTAYPMLGLSGAWFSMEGAPLSLQRFAEFLPLTHVVQAARAIAIEGETLGEQWDHILILLAMTVIFVLVGTLLFNWESDHR